MENKTGGQRGGIKIITPYANRTCFTKKKKKEKIIKVDKNIQKEKQKERKLKTTKVKPESYAKLGQTYQGKETSISINYKGSSIHIDELKTIKL